ncbi:MAG: HD domain-containing protein [Candidatus Anstonellaceae archaeon]
MIRIRDPLHGTVQLTPFEEKLLDTPQMQMLRGVRQLAMAYLVYPGANHTRFEHSIGTLFLADKICRELSLPSGQSEKIRAAALLHDVGHVAFSHEAEAVLKEKIGDHEKVGKRLILKSEVADVLQEKFSPAEIAGIYSTPLGQIITSDIGADRMDYLLRDSHYTGVAYGVVDADRICGSIRMEKGGLVLSERGLAAAESLLVARFTMFHTVYLHKTVRIASRMLQQAITLAIEGCAFSAEDAIGMTDSHMLDALMRCPASQPYVHRLRNRWLFKKAYSFAPDKMRMSVSKAERELSEKCGCPVLIDVPRISLEAEIKVDYRGKREPLSKVSELVASLQKMQKSRMSVMVICEEKSVRKVSEAARKMFG